MCQQKNCAVQQQKIFASRIKSLATAFYLCQCRPMEHLNTYLEQNGLKAKWFAERVGIKPGRISRIRTGKAKPDLNEALRIAEFTKSAVPVEAWQ